MKAEPLFRNYEYLVDKADRAFQAAQEEYGNCIRCKRHCADCCHAVFGLFLIEAASIKHHFDRLGIEERKATLLRCNETERGLARLERKLRVHGEEPQLQAMIMAKERIRCPFLNDELDCVLYAHRPITCRVYGIPTRIQGKARVCGLSGFKEGETYPLFDLDGIYRELHTLSREFLSATGEESLEKASLLVSLAKAITTPTDQLIREIAG